MKFMETGQQRLTVMLFFAAVVVAGCGAGSSTSGGGAIRSAEPTDPMPLVGIIPTETLTALPQDGTYGLPAVAFLTDINIADCAGGSADATAVSSSTERMFAMSCVDGPVNVVDFPGGGGTLLVNLNSGGPVTVLIREARSISTGNN